MQSPERSTFVWMESTGTTRSGCTRMIKKNDVYNKMGSVCRGSNDVRFKDRIDNISADNHGRIFCEYILTFMQAFLDDFAMNSQRMERLDHLQICLEKCRNARLSLDPAKCAFEMTSDTLLEHIVSKDQNISG